MQSASRVQVSPHVHALKIPFFVDAPTGKIPRFVYCYLVLGQRITLIDSGVAGTETAIFEAVERLGRGAEEIGLLVLTHSHPDHIGAARAIRNKTGCQVAAHPSERDWIERVDLQAKERPVPGFASLVYGSVPVDRELLDGAELELDNDLRLQVIHTPGHSRGSISLKLLPDRALFAGDTIPLPGDMPIYDNAPDSVASIERLLELDQVDWLLSAWDDPQSGPAVHERMLQGLSYLRRVHRAVRDVALADGPMDPLRLCQRVIGHLALPPSMANPLVARSLQANLAALNDPAFSASRAANTESCG